MSAIPNWCENRVYIHADAPQDLQAVLEAVALRDDNDEVVYSFSLQAFRPCPAELKGISSPNRDNPAEMIAKYGFADWYDWQLANWGTKWDIQADLQLTSLYEAESSFDSAWSPPVIAMEYLSRLFPNVTIAISYDEPGVDFGGYTIFRGGGIVAEAQAGSRSTTWHQMLEWELENLPDDPSVIIAETEDLPTE